MKISYAVIAAALSVSTNALADATRPDSHAPISVMGDHVHQAGEFMFSYRFMTMSMQGNLDGSSDISAQEIVTSQANRFANPPIMPPTLRVVPTKMTMNMHMLGMMYAPDDRVTLMGMLNYSEKEMDHVTFAGPMGVSRLGEFTTKSSGIGDTTVAALVKLGGSHEHAWHATLGISLPTGSIDETDTILTPMGTQLSPRLPYPMQLGSGTYDLLSGLTYAGRENAWGWGAQWRSTFRLGENDEAYRLGDEHKLQGWVSYLVNPSLSVSARLAYYDRGNIDGIDPRIALPVQTADPDRQAVERVDVGLGINFLVPTERYRVAFEVNFPLSQDLDGPQLETDWYVTLGVQFTP